MFADMAELADALDSGSSEVKLIQVQVLLSAPRTKTLRSNDRSVFSFYTKICLQFVFAVILRLKRKGGKSNESKNVLDYRADGFWKIYRF